MGTWWDKKAKEFVNKHVVIPINMSMVESHHERLSDMGQYQNRLQSQIMSLKSGYMDLFNMIMGEDKDLDAGGMVHVDGLLEVVRKQNKKINELEKALDQLGELAGRLPKINELASKNELISAINGVHNEIDTVKEQIRYSNINENFEVAQKGEKDHGKE